MDPLQRLTADAAPASAQGRATASRRRVRAGTAAGAGGSASTTASSGRPGGGRGYPARRHRDAPTRLNNRAASGIGKQSSERPGWRWTDSRARGGRQRLGESGGPTSHDTEHRHGGNAQELMPPHLQPPGCSGCDRRDDTPLASAFQAWCSGGRGIGRC